MHLLHLHHPRAGHLVPIVPSDLHWPTAATDLYALHGVAPTAAFVRAFNVENLVAIQWAFCWSVTLLSREHSVIDDWGHCHEIFRRRWKDGRRSVRTHLLEGFLQFLELLVLNCGVQRARVWLRNQQDCGIQEFHCWLRQTPSATLDDPLEKCLHDDLLGSVIAENAVPPAAREELQYAGVVLLFRDPVPIAI